MERGAASEWDVLLAQAAVARARLATTRAQGAADKAMSALLEAMGARPGTPLLLPPLPDEVPTERQRELSEWLEMAQTFHPGIKAAQLQWDAARQKVIATSAEGLPTVDFIASYLRNGDPNQALTSTRTNVWTTGLSLSMPIFEGFARTYKVMGSQAEVAQREAQWRDTTQQVLSEVTKAFAEAKAASANKEAAAQLVHATHAAYGSAMRRYEGGRISMSELVEALSALTEAQQEEQRALAEWSAARLHLLTSAGIMGREYDLK